MDNQNKMKQEFDAWVKDYCAKNGHFPLQPEIADYWLIAIAEANSKFETAILAMKEEIHYKDGDFTRNVKRTINETLDRVLGLHGITF